MYIRLEESGHGWTFWCRVVYIKMVMSTMVGHKPETIQ